MQESLTLLRPATEGGVEFEGEGTPMRFNFRHRGPWLLATAATALMFAGGIAYATIPASDGTINGCYRTAGGDNQGQLRIVDNASSCRSNETAIQFNQQGVAGPAGPPGPSSAQSVSPSFVRLSGRTTVGTMTVDAGAYAIQAKTVVADDAGESVYVFCFLDANNPADEDTSATMVGTGSARQTVALQLTHTFTSAGTITLSCQPTKPTRHDQRRRGTHQDHRSQGR